MTKDAYPPSLSRLRERAGVRAAGTLRHARRLRSEQTDAERRLWFELRDRRLLGVKFRRQVPIGRYIADFACLDPVALTIELDGGQHAVVTGYDTKRTAWFEEHGWRVLRFWNNDVLQNADGVLLTIAIALGAEAAGPHPGPLPQAGEGVGT